MDMEGEAAMGSDLGMKTQGFWISGDRSMEVVCIFHPCILYNGQVQ